MTALLDLPDEVLLMIVGYLQSQTHGREVILPFFQIGDTYRYAFGQNQPPRVKDLRSLLLTCQRFRYLLEPFLYHEIFIRQYNRINEKRPLDQFQWTLDNSPSLEEHTTSVMVPCADAKINSFLSTGFRFFWLPNLTTLTLHELNDWDELEFENSSHVGTSPVEHLRLINCGAHEGVLTAMLSWPKALKSLLYDVEQGEWEVHGEDDPAREWTCEAFVRTLQSQKHTLEELAMTRPRLDHEGLFNGPAIHLGEFSAMKVLRIYHVFLCGIDDSNGISRRFPPKLEVLEVFYDDTDLTTFLDEGENNLQGDHFLGNLVRNKKECLPRLHKINVFTDEAQYDFDMEEKLEQRLWKLPAFLARQADEAGIDVQVWLGSEHYQKNQEFDVLCSLEVSQQRVF